LNVTEKEEVGMTDMHDWRLRMGKNDSQKVQLAPPSEPLQVLERGIVDVVKGPRVSDPGIARKLLER
jgi:hypothetical protein